MIGVHARRSFCQDEGVYVSIADVNDTEKNKMDAPISAKDFICCHLDINIQPVLHQTFASALKSKDILHSKAEFNVV